MACYSPLRAYWTKRSKVTGRRGITFSPAFAFDTKEVLDLPCGQCVGCRLEKSRQWAMRCMHEARLHPKNVFLTLTYNDENLPPGGTLVKRDFQLFMKRLRFEDASNSIRYFAAGEYGELNKRPHYHAILFNCDFADKRRIGQNGNGQPYYTSKIVERLWPVGFNTIGDVSFDSAAYVARYCLKKVTGAAADAHYEVVDGNGEVFRREPEFALMSRRPGVGAGYYERFGHEVRAHDSVVINGREVRPPRFYDSRTDSVDPERLRRLKVSRRRKAFLLRDDNTPSRRRVKEIVTERRLEQKKRNV